jgi:CRP-like cAMP-binding protein
MIAFSKKSYILFGFCSIRIFGSPRRSHMITLRQYAPGEVVIRERDPGETAYIIERGRVEVTKELNGEDVHLGFMGPGEIFGEMSMIDDKPRSATITAIEETLTREIHRDGFFQSLQTNPEIGLNLLKVLFERLREAHGTILQLQLAGAVPELQPPAQVAETIDQPEIKVLIEGMTPQAACALPADPFQITRFPFRIGRLSDDPLAHNDLMIPDSPPLQVSRHHVTLISQEGRVGVFDRGSTLGALVDGRQLGGPSGDPGPAFFSGSEGILILGSKNSPFIYKVVIEQRA